MWDSILSPGDNIQTLHVKGEYRNTTVEPVKSSLEVLDSHSYANIYSMNSPLTIIILLIFLDDEIFPSQRNIATFSASIPYRNGRVVQYVYPDMQGLPSSMTGHVAQP